MHKIYEMTKNLCLNFQTVNVKKYFGFYLTNH